MNRCLVCGRPLMKSNGPIGPTCLRKRRTYSMSRRSVKDANIKYLRTNDIFKEGDDGPEKA